MGFNSSRVLVALGWSLIALSIIPVLLVINGKKLNLFGILVLVLGIILLVIGYKSKKNDISYQPKNDKIPTADNLIKYKQLLDQGVITQEEFDAKKRELLGR